MKINKILILFILLTSCASGGKTLSSEKFLEVSVGTSVDDLEKKLGKPYSIKNLCNGEIEYTYIQKDDFGARGVLEERHYIFIIKNNKVIRTDEKILNRPAYDEPNSYEMQTTSN
jgi:hypothetical protein